MLSRVIVNIIRRSVCNNARTLCYPQYPLQSSRYIKQHSVQNHYNLHVARRFKSSRKKSADIKKNKDEDFDEENEENDEKEAPAGSKITKVRVPSIRLDAICKAGFGMSRSKVEEVFYESRFRINGNKVFKKSKEVDVGDEIDMILHQSLDNLQLLVVNRIVILSMDPVNDGIEIKLAKDKNLLIEDYEDPYLGQST